VVGGTGSVAEIDLPRYRVTVASGALDRVGSIVSSVAPAHRYALISDRTVAPLYAVRVAHSFGDAEARVSQHTVESGERHKTRESWARLTDELLATGAGRDTTVLALGGGVVGDLAGFVAATYMRGVPVVQIPTTLLAMVDASIGGKTGVDTPSGKNLVGSFHQPCAVIADPGVLLTLSSAHLRAGIAEVIKHGVVADENYFDDVVGSMTSLVDPVAADRDAMHRIVARSIAIKAAIVTEDELEGGRRRVLNFGHTLGHAIETLSGFSLLHGEAVAVGMVLEARLAERLAIAEPGTAERIRSAVRSAGLGDTRPSTMTPAAILDATRSDKKARHGSVEYALPARIGAMAGEADGWSIPVADAEVLAVLDR
jgi:3-dehydroquinate synthase